MSSQDSFDQKLTALQRVSDALSNKMDKLFKRKHLISQESSASQKEQPRPQYKTSYGKFSRGQSHSTLHVRPNRSSTVVQDMNDEIVEQPRPAQGNSASTLIESVTESARRREPVPPQPAPNVTVNVTSFQDNSGQPIVNGPPVSIPPIYPPGFDPNYSGPPSSGPPFIKPSYPEPPGLNPNSGGAINPRISPLQSLIRPIQQLEWLYLHYDLIWASSAIGRNRYDYIRSHSTFPISVAYLSKSVYKERQSVLLYLQLLLQLQLLHLPNLSGIIKSSNQSYMRRICSWNNQNRPSRKSAHFIETTRSVAAEWCLVIFIKLIFEFIIEYARVWARFADIPLQGSL